MLSKTGCHVLIDNYIILMQILKRVERKHLGKYSHQKHIMLSIKGDGK